MFTSLLSTLLVAVASQSAPAPAPGRQSAASEARSPAPSTIDFRISPIVDLHMLVRKQAAPPPGDSVRAAPPADPGDAAAAAGDAELSGRVDAIAALRALQEAIGGGRAWLTFDGNFLDCARAADVIAVFEQLPETRGAAGEEVPLRAPALAYARALEIMEPAFLKDHWPARRETIAARVRELQETFQPRARACLDHIMASLGMSDPGVCIPAYLTVTGPWPGAQTARRFEGDGVCFIAIDEAGGTLFHETILHEATHALDLATHDQNHALNEMRVRLTRAGIEQRDPRWRDAWHTIMFIQAADAVRRHIDPAHQDYGDVAKYYENVPQIAAIERPIWREYLAGAITREEAIARIVAEVAALQAGPGPGAKPGA